MNLLFGNLTDILEDLGYSFVTTLLLVAVPNGNEEMCERISFWGLEALNELYKSVPYLGIGSSLL